MKRKSLVLLLICVTAGYWLASCRTKELPKGDEVMAISVTLNLPVVNWDSSITAIKRSYHVFYYKDYRMYMLSYQYDSNVNRRNLKSEKRNMFLVFQQDSAYGYIYYPYAGHPAIDRVVVDSMLQFSTFRSNSLDTLLNFPLDSSYTNEEDNLVKVYHISSSALIPESFTYYLFYNDKLKNVPETFSKQMDNEKNRKLFKIRSVAHGGYYENFKMSFPEREMYYEMKEVKVENTKEILGYFQRYIREHSKG